MANVKTKRARKARRPVEGSLRWYREEWRHTLTAAGVPNEALTFELAGLSYENRALRRRVDDLTRAVEKLAEWNERLARDATDQAEETATIGEEVDELSDRLGGKSASSLASSLAMSGTPKKPRDDKPN